MILWCHWMMWTEHRKYFPMNMCWWRQHQPMRTFSFQLFWPWGMRRFVLNGSFKCLLNVCPYGLQSLGKIFILNTANMPMCQCVKLLRGKMNWWSHLKKKPVNFCESKFVIMPIPLAEEQTLLEKYTEVTMLLNMTNFHFSIWHIIIVNGLLQCTVLCHNTKRNDKSM